MHRERNSGDYTIEKRLHAMVKSSAKVDWGQGLSDLAGSGSWKALRQLRKGAKHPQGCLKDRLGNNVESCSRADTFGQYLQDIQWAVRPATLLDSAPFGQLSVATEERNMKELTEAAASLSNFKAAGPDEQPVDF